MIQAAVIVPPSMDPRLVYDREANAGYGIVHPAGRISYPPLVSAEVVSMLQGYGYSVKVLDLSRVAPYEGLQRIKNLPPVAVAAVNTSLASWWNDTIFASSLRKYHPSIKIIAFGNGLTLMPARYRHDIQPYDSVAWGYPLGSLPHILTDSITCSLVGCERLQTPPNWGAFCLDEYSFLSIESSSGCHFGCEWCPYPVVQGEYVRLKDMRLLKTELTTIAEHASKGTILQFRDPLFPCSRERMEAIFSLISLVLPAHIAVGVETRVEYLDEDVIRDASEAGIRNINLGIESGDPFMLSATKPGIGSMMDAVTYLQRANRVMQDCLEYGIRPFAMFLLGLPGESEQSLQATVDFAKSLPDEIGRQASLFIPIPGTKIYKKLGSLADSALSSVLRGRRRAGDPIAGVCDVSIQTLADAKEQIDSPGNPRSAIPK
ncbi:MAG: radical SAM protein [Candidatus Aegiribacteria sp.]|nr:radical SAM protein [Candidatus Aegiribacteria sp.]